MEQIFQRKFKFTNQEGVDISSEIYDFVDFSRLSRVAPGRCSILLALELYGGLKSGHQDPFKIVREIEILEGSGERSQFKPATPFTRPPLKGLWHKHYLEDGLNSMALNLKKGLKKHGIPAFQRRIDQSKLEGVERFMVEEDIPEVVNDAISGNWIGMADAAQLTGEWIVYAIHEGRKYYLCLGRHTEGDAAIRKKLNEVCCAEFEFLNSILC